MRQLLLLRHAKSAWDHPGLPDHARGLDGRGREAAAAMGALLSALPPPERVLVSTARRTRETLAALGAWAEAETEARDALYLASLDALLDQVRALPARAARVLVIGHNPGLHELALALADRGERGRLEAGFPTCAFAEFVSTATWPEFGLLPSRMLRFVRPRDIGPT